MINLESFFGEAYIRNYQNKFPLYNKPNEYHSKGLNLPFLYNLKLVHLINRSLHHSKTKMKGLDVLFYLMLLYFSILS